MPKRAEVGEEGPEWWWKKYPPIETEEELNEGLLVPKHEWPYELGCRVKDCTMTHYGRGLCSKHFKMAKNQENRHPIARKARQIIARQKAPKRDLEYTHLEPVFGQSREKPEWMRGTGRMDNPNFNPEWDEAIVAWVDSNGEQWEKLTEVQEQFCQNYIIARMNATEAARQAGLGKDEGKTLSSAGVSRRANFWLNIHPVVRNRLWELREEQRAKHRVTLEDHLVELSRLREAAVAVNQMSAAITAEKARGAAAGLYVQRTELTVEKVDSMSKDDVLRRLHELQAQHDAIIDVTPTHDTRSEGHDRSVETIQPALTDGGTGATIQGEIVQEGGTSKPTTEGLGDLEKIPAEAGTVVEELGVRD